MMGVERFGLRVGLKRQRREASISCNLQNVLEQPSADPTAHCADVDEQRLQIAGGWSSVDRCKAQNLAVLFGDEDVSRAALLSRIREFMSTQFEEVRAVVPVTFRPQG